MLSKIVSVLWCW